MEEGTTPPPKSNQQIRSKWKEYVDVTKLIFYFRLSKTFLMAAVAISGVTEMYA